MIVLRAQPRFEYIFTNVQKIIRKQTLARNDRKGYYEKIFLIGWVELFPFGR
jgi:hypothetical protein